MIDHQNILNLCSLSLISLFLLQKIHTKYATFRQTGWCPCPPGATSSYVISRAHCDCSLVSLPHSCSQPSSISQWATKWGSPSTGACDGTQTWITHLPCKGRQRQGAEGLSEEHVLPAGPLLGDEAIPHSHLTPAWVWISTWMKQLLPNPHNQLKIHQWKNVNFSFPEVRRALLTAGIKNRST